MPWKYEIYSKKVTNMLRKVYWKKNFSGKRIFNYSFQLLLSILPSNNLQEPIGAILSGRLLKHFFMFLKSAHNHSLVHIWVDVYSNEYSRLKINRNNFCCVIVDYCFFGEELWKYIISDFHLPPNSSLKFLTQFTNWIIHSSIRNIKV